MIDKHGRFFYFDKMDLDGLNGRFVYWDKYTKNCISHRGWRLKEKARIIYDDM